MLICDRGWYDNLCPCLPDVPHLSVLSNGSDMHRKRRFPAPFMPGNMMADMAQINQNKFSGPQWTSAVCMRARLMNVAIESWEELIQAISVQRYLSRGYDETLGCVFAAKTGQIPELMHYIRYTYGPSNSRKGYSSLPSLGGILIHPLSFLSVNTNTFLSTLPVSGGEQLTIITSPLLSHKDDNWLS